MEGHAWGIALALAVLFMGSSGSIQHHCSECALFFLVIIDVLK